MNRTMNVSSFLLLYNAMRSGIHGCILYQRRSVRRFWFLLKRDLSVSSSVPMEAFQVLRRCHQCSLDWFWFCKKTTRSCCFHLLIASNEINPIGKHFSHREERSSSWINLLTDLDAQCKALRCTRTANLQNQPKFVTLTKEQNQKQKDTRKARLVSVLDAALSLTETEDADERYEDES